MVAVLSVGFALQWGVAPLYFWLPNAYQRAGPGAAAVAVCIAGPATLGLLIQSLSALPPAGGRRVGQPPADAGGPGDGRLRGGGALAPAKLRRTLGYILVADLGLVIAGLATFSRIGLTGATLHMAHRRLVALLLLAAAAELERVDRGAPDDGRPAPYLWGTILVGSLVLVGVPPFSGFARHLGRAAGPDPLGRAPGAGPGRHLSGLPRRRPHLPGAPPAQLPPPLAPPPQRWRCPDGTGPLRALWGSSPGRPWRPVHRAAAGLPFLKPL